MLAGVAAYAATNWIVGLTSNSSGEAQSSTISNVTISAAARPIQGLLASQQAADARAPGKPAFHKSMRPQDLMAVEVDRLLEDIRMAFERDLSTATWAAGRLAALLASGRA